MGSSIWVSSRHHGLGTFSLLKWRLRVHKSPSFRNYSVTTHCVLWSQASHEPVPFKGREHRWHLPIGRVSQSSCRTHHVQWEIWLWSSPENPTCHSFSHKVLAVLLLAIPPHLWHIILIQFLAFLGFGPWIVLLLLGAALCRCTSWAEHVRPTAACWLGLLCTFSAPLPRLLSTHPQICLHLSSATVLSPGLLVFCELIPVWFIYSDFGWALGRRQRKIHILNLLFHLTVPCFHFFS